MPDEKNKSDDDIEAEMLRMMEQEASGTPAAGAEAAETQEAAPSDNLEDEMMKMMQQAMTEPQQDAAAGGAPPADDQVLEMEMLKAMQGDNGGGGESTLPFPAFAPAAAETAPAGGLSRLLDVHVRITVELGANQTPIKDILVWGEGTVVELERMDREPVDVLVNEKLFARGEVVVVGEAFGIRITELLNGPSRR